MTAQLKKIRKKRGLSQADVAARLGIQVETYNRLENEKTDLTLSRMKELAEILDVEPTDLIANSFAMRKVHVRAFVEAGSWHDTADWPEDEWYDVAVPDAPDFRHSALYGAETRGPSMNRIYPEGTVVIFTSFIEHPEDITPGKKYIVERERPDGLRETTVKTLWQDEEGEFWLVPESTDPRHRTPIELNAAEGYTIRITGKVVYSVRRED